MKRVKCFGAFLLTLCLVQTAFAGFEGSVSQTTVPEGESFQLYLRQDGGAEQPDISVLEKDFTVVGQRKSYKTSYINGKTQKYNELILTLIPKKSGKVILPSIQAGKEKTAEITLNVVPSGTAVSIGGDAQASVQSQVFVRAEVNTQKPLIQEQIVYTVRLYTSTPILDGMVIPPQSDVVKIEQWEDPKRSRTTLNGQPYVVTEYKFVLFPQKSGKISIPSTKFQGVISDPHAERDNMDEMFDGFGFGRMPSFSGFLGQKSIAVQSKEIVLDVQPKPEAAGEAPWLPATDVAVSEDIVPAKASVTIGDALTRTVTVMASGVRDTQVPDPSFPDGSGYKQYPGKTDSKNVFDKNGIVGVKTKQIVFMPTETGALILPKMEIPWFDTKTKKMKKAVLPERRVTVIPGEDGAASASSPSVQVPAQKTSNEVKRTEAVLPVQGVLTEKEAPKILEEQLSAYPMLGYLLKRPVLLFCIGVMLGGCVVFLLWLLLRFSVKAQKGRRVGKDQESEFSLQKAVKMLKDACATETPAEAKAALLKIGASYWRKNPPLTLSDLANRFSDDAFFIQIEKLNQALYAKQGSSWSGDDLWRAFRGTRQYGQIKKTAEKVPVPPLYPS